MLTVQIPVELDHSKCQALLSNGTMCDAQPMYMIYDSNFGTVCPCCEKHKSQWFLANIGFTDHCSVYTIEEFNIINMEIMK